MGIETLIILVLTSLFGLYMAWNIGANDVANAMGTSVGSGALTLKSAVVVAAILEFGGAVFVGGHVTETVRKGMLDLSLISDPKILMIGMLSSLLASGIWLHMATYKGWPVSTTHSIVGAIVGFGVVFAGLEVVKWGKVTSIVSSWVISPVLSGIIALLIFIFIRKFIFESEHPLRAMKLISPFIIFVVFEVICLVTTYKGLKNLKMNLSFLQALLISTAISAFLALVGGILIARIINKAEHKHQEEQKSEIRPFKLEFKYKIIEKIFIYLQIMSACTVAFAHGANDVANAIGPVATVWEIATTGVLSPKVAVNPLFLAVGGIGIVIGLATWGWRIIETIGKKITDLTPTRGFSAEFGAACTILMASRLGLPVSTTHCLVGAVIGVGFARGMSSINLKMVGKILLSWVFTLPVAAIIAVICYVTIDIFI